MIYEREPYTYKNLEAFIPELCKSIKNGELTFVEVILALVGSEVK